MMQQYFKIKEENKDSILFFRLGDFYEMFYDDAKLASKVRVTLQDLLQRAIRLQFANRRKILQRQKVL